ncbi:MAG: AraC family transcriptional regulator [Microbacterium sp.]|uniref:helix-turn-helix transcriptional regulator n=1 Tax=Microbacterium sp. TaxID=51671 RepID=UPI00324223ED
MTRQAHPPATGAPGHPQTTGNAPTADWDEASHAVASAYFAHRLHPERRSTAAHVAVSGSQFGPVRIATIGWGALVDVETHHPGAVAVNVPLGGTLRSVVGGRDHIGDHRSATVYPADTPVLIRGWAPSCRIVGVRFEQDFLRQEIARVTGDPQPLPTSIDLTSTAGASWLRLVESLQRQPNLPPIVVDQLAGAVTDAFVLAMIPEDAARAPAPRIVKRVTDRIEAEPELPWTAGDMAEVAGVSVRRLQEGFRRYVGESPRSYLMRVRLARTREDLQRSDADTVADIALRWGFTHTSRFAAAYRRAFGEHPSVTLRRG